MIKEVALIIFVVSLFLFSCTNLPPTVSNEEVTEEAREELVEDIGDDLNGGSEEVETKPIETKANADVTYVKAVLSGEKWTFYVTVQHPDKGWDDYVDGWDVLADGEVIKKNPADKFTRLLTHPHDEKPFTRSQSGLVIPEEVTLVKVRAHDLVDGFGGKEVIVNLSREKGNGYEIVR